MRKGILLLVITILFFSSCFSLAYRDDKESRFIVEDDMLQIVLEVNVEKEEIYNKLLEWIPITFTADDSEIIKSLEFEGISGKGNVVMTARGLLLIIPVQQVQNMHFRYNMEIKDRKIRITLTDFYFYSAGSSENPSFQTKSYLDKSYYDLVAGGIQEEKIISNLLSYIEGKEKNTDW